MYKKFSIYSLKLHGPLQVENPDAAQNRYLDFLDILLAAKDETGQGMGNREIQVEVDTFLFAGELLYSVHNIL